MGFCPDKPIMCWRHLKLQMYLIHLTYAHHSVVSPTFNMLRAVTWAYIWAKSSNPKPICHKVLNISCNLLNTVLKVKNRMFVWVQTVVSVSAVDPVIVQMPGSCGSLCCPAQCHERTRLHTTSLETEPDLKLNAYHICTIVESKNWNILSRNIVNQGPPVSFPITDMLSRQLVSEEYCSHRFI